MSTDLFTFVSLYDKQLVATAHLLDKAAAHLGSDAGSMLDWRLIDDMHPLGFQVRVVINFTRSWTARAAGLEPPASIEEDADLAALRVGIADARAYLAALTREQFAGRDDVPLTVQIGLDLTPTMPAERWLTGFATTNIYFHVAMVYAILRARGVPIGKIDLFAGAL